MFEMMKNVDEKLFKKNIKNIITVFMFLNPKFKYRSDLLKIISFFLCFLDEENAFWVFSTIFSEIIPQKFEITNFRDENLLLLKELIILRKKEENKIKSFLSNHLENVVNSLMINILNFQCFFYTIDLLITSNSVKQ